jgi:hypothetical protein
MALLYFNPEGNIYCNIMLIDCYGMGERRLKLIAAGKIDKRNIFPHIGIIEYISVSNITAFNQDHTLELLSTLYLLFLLCEQ